MNIDRIIVPQTIDNAYYFGIFNRKKCFKRALTVQLTPRRIWVGARNTLESAVATPTVSGDLSCPEFCHLRIPQVSSQVFGQGASVRKAGGMADSMLRTPCPPYACRNAKGGGLSQSGDLTMSTNGTHAPYSFVITRTRRGKTIVLNSFHVPLNSPGMGDIEGIDAFHELINKIYSGDAPPCFKELIKSLSDALNEPLEHSRRSAAAAFCRCLQAAITHYAMSSNPAGWLNAMSQQARQQEYYNRERIEARAYQLAKGGQQ